MPAPVLLVIEVEQPEGLSTRKLVLETAKFNVVTAYTGRDALIYLDQFPNFSAIVLHTGILDIPFKDLLAEIRKRDQQRRYPICLVTPHFESDELADAAIPSGDPERLLSLLRSWTGGP
jgi:DNA-binding response OmpR family regulator